MQFKDFLTTKKLLPKNLNDLAENKNTLKTIILEKIAKNGRMKYFKYFNSKIVAQYILDKTLGIKKNNYYWEKKIK